MGQNEIIEILHGDFVYEVVEDGSDLYIVISNGSVSDSIIYYRYGKRSWGVKPLSRNRYMMVDADTGGILTYLDGKYGIKEDDLQQVRGSIIKVANELLQQHLNPSPNPHNKDTNNI